MYLSKWNVSILAILASCVLVGCDGTLGPASNNGETASSSSVGTSTPLAVTWMFGSSDIKDLGTAVNKVFAQPGQPGPIIILASLPNTISGTHNDCMNPTAFPSKKPTTPWTTSEFIYRYTAECQLEVDIAQGAIPNWIKWIMYDNEICTEPPTPPAEQFNPPIYFAKAAKAAHAAGLKMYATAGLSKALHKVQNNCGPTDPTYADPGSMVNVFQMWKTAHLWDGVDFQVQHGINDPASLVKNTKLLLSRAQDGGLPSNAEIVAGIGNIGCYYIPEDSVETKVCGPIDPGTQEEAVHMLYEIGVNAFWGNYGPHPTSGPGGAGLCTAPTLTNPKTGMTYSPYNPYGTCALISAESYAQFGSLISDIANGTYNAPLGPYGNL